MKGTVHYSADGELAVLRIDNPPVNPLSSGVRQGLFDGLSAALADDAVKAETPPKDKTHPEDETSAHPTHEN